MQVHQICSPRLGLVQSWKTIKDCIRLCTGRDYARGSVGGFWWCNGSLPKKKMDRPTRGDGHDRPPEHLFLCHEFLPNPFDEPCPSQSVTTTVLPLPSFHTPLRGSRPPCTVHQRLDIPYLLVHLSYRSCLTAVATVKLLYT